MTTIAFNGKELATDSLSTIGTEIYSHASQKIYQGVGPFDYVAGAGMYQDLLDYFELLLTCETMDAVRALCNGDEDTAINVIGITREGRAWSCNRSFAYELIPGIPWAAGSGAEYALGAMDMGASPSKAVKIAKGRDTNTGGDVQVVTLDTSHIKHRGHPSLYKANTKGDKQ